MRVVEEPLGSVNKVNSRKVGKVCSVPSTEADFWNDLEQVT